MRITARLETKKWSQKMKWRRTRGYPSATRQLAIDTAEYAKEAAIRQSSFREYVIGRGRKNIGNVRNKKMHRAAPYSKRFPRNSGPTDDSEINIQSQEYVQSWYVAMKPKPTGYMTGIGNRSEHAKYIHQYRGAGWMRERPILRGITNQTLRRSFRHHQMFYHQKALGQLPE